MKTLLGLSLAILFGFSVRAQTPAQTVSSVTVLLSMPSSLSGYTFFCEGLTASGDGSPATGFYRYYPSATDTTNAWAVFTPPYGGRWKRLSGLVADITYAAATGSTSASTRAGVVQFAIGGGTNLVVTNSLVSTGSVIFAQALAYDQSARQTLVTPAAGSFSITLPATNTALLPVAWFLINP